MSHRHLDDEALCENWREQWQLALDHHFEDAHQRLDRVYRQHFTSLSAVCDRHRRHWRDIPGDLLAMPRALWRMLRRRPADRARRLTGKEQEVALLLANEVLDLSGLRQRLEAQIHTSPMSASPLREPSLPDDEQATRRLHQAVARWGGSHEGGRELLLFVLLGVAGRSLSDKVVIGSASLVGVSMASSLYISQQGILGGWWASWFGVPSWVSITGAVVGACTMLVLTPLFAPLIECLFNRMWRRRRLHRLIDEVHRELLPPRREQLWQWGGYMQYLPDLLALLRTMP